MGYFHTRKKRLISLMKIIEDSYFCKIFVNDEVKMNWNQVSKGVFQDTFNIMVGINLIKHKAGKCRCPIHS